MSQKIAIIGAGMAGLSAAHALRQAGLPLQLFDKSRGSGGRLSSKRSEIGALDLGTPGFLAHDPALRTMLVEWTSAGSCASWAAVDDPQPYWVGTPRMSAISRGLLGDLPAAFSCRISEVFRGEHHWQLLDTEGVSHGPFSHIIVAVPAPQAAALLSAAPMLAARAASVVMEPVWAVALGFAEALPCVRHSLRFDDEILRQATHDSAKPGRDNRLDSWVLHATAGWTRRHLDLPKEAVIDRLAHAFAERLGQCLPPAEFAIAHRWLYAYPARRNDWGALADSQGGLFAWGDWCLDGTVEGAWRSGARAAQLLLASL